MVLGNEQAVQLYKCIDGRMETYPDQYGSTISFNSKSLAHTHSNPHFWYKEVTPSTIRHARFFNIAATSNNHFAGILNTQKQDIKQSRYGTKMTISIEEE